MISDLPTIYLKSAEDLLLTTKNSQILGLKNNYMSRFRPSNVLIIEDFCRFFYLFKQISMQFCHFLSVHPLRCRCLWRTWHWQSNPTLAGIRVTTGQR